MTRTTIISLVTLCLGTAAHADSRVEVGAAFGGHAFSGNGELGVDDAMTEPGPVSSVALAARAAVILMPRLAAEGELIAIPTKDDVVGDSAIALGMRAHVRVDLLRGRLRPFVLAGVGMHLLRPSSPQMTSDADQAYHWGFGVRWALGAALDLRFDARHLIVPDRTLDGATSDFEITAGVSYRFGAAPAQGTRAVSVASRAPAPDATSHATDRDLDLIADTADRCPTETEDVDGFEDGDGCPELDNDRDRIADVDDICPTDKETVNDYRDSDGCPDQVIAGLADITFAQGSAALEPAAQPVLDRAQQMLEELPGLFLEVSGHTAAKEAKGDRAMTLSLQRAEAVKAALVKRGIAAARILTVGHGSDRNRRRVEFRTMTPDEIPL